jgi:hypothetical protein
MLPVVTDVGPRGAVVIVTGGGSGIGAPGVMSLDGGQVIDRE